MKKILLLPVIAVCLFFVACNNSDSPKSIAQKWCDLNAKVAKADNAEAREKALKERKEYEDKIEKKYKNDTAMSRKVNDEVEKCEGASEGK